MQKCPKCNSKLRKDIDGCYADYYFCEKCKKGFRKPKGKELEEEPMENNDSVIS